MTEIIKSNFNSIENISREQDIGAYDIDLEDVGFEFNFTDMEFPEIGTPAHRRLVDACLNYHNAVNRMKTNPRAQVDDKFTMKSNELIRFWHNKLCDMILGKSWKEVEEDDRAKKTDNLEKIRLFAYAVSSEFKQIEQELREAV